MHNSYLLKFDQASSTVCRPGFVECGVYKMSVGATLFKTGTRVITRARLAGNVRLAGIVRAAPISIPLRNLRTSAVAHDAAPETSTAVNTQAPRASSGPLGSELKPADMLSFLNSENFSSYRSISSNQNSLFDDNEGLAVTALTHESWMYGLQGHNRRLAFLGTCTPAHPRPSRSQDLPVSLPL